MNILLIGNNHFRSSFERLGHTVTCMRGERGEKLDVSGMECDLIIVHESLGMREFPHGMERPGVPRVFYAVDTHLNLLWHREYAQLFDFVFVSQKDYVQRLGHTNAHWLPWSIDGAVFKDCNIQRNQDIVFIGTVDEQRLKRRNIILELGKRFNIKVYGTDPHQRLTQKQMAYVYSSAKIVLNESILGEITFRTFEATACGAMLLTERVANGLEELFKDGEEIVTYDRIDLIDKAAFYLRDNSARSDIALKGEKRTLSRYTVERAAARILETIFFQESGRHRLGVERLRLAHGKALFFAATKFPRYRKRRLKRAELLLRVNRDMNSNETDAPLFLALTHVAQGRLQYALEMLKPSAHHHQIRHFYCMIALAGGAKQEVLESIRLIVNDDSITYRNILTYLSSLYEQYGMPFYPGSPSLESIPLNAVECYVRSGTAEGFKRAGMLAYEANAHGLALELLSKAKDMMPGDNGIRRTLAYAYLKLYDVDSGLQELATTIGVDGLGDTADLNDSEKHILNGIIHARHGNYTNAIESFQYADTAPAYLRLGWLYLELSEPEKAFKCGQRVLSLMPYDRHAQRLLKLACGKCSVPRPEVELPENVQNYRNIR